MSGYRRDAMVRTPWGNSQELRERKLPPGRGTPPEEVACSQRERLFGAMVAVVSEQGYEGTRVADLLAVSGVSRKAFYELFAGKRECFLAAVRAVMEVGSAAMLEGFMKPGSWEERIQGGLATMTGMLAAQPAAAKMCFVEIYAAGPEAVKVAEQTTAAFEALMRESLAGMLGPERMPAEIVRALTGGCAKVIHTRLHRGEVSKLESLAPAFASWVMSYRPPPEPLRQSPRTKRAPGIVALPDRDPAERIIRATAEVVAAQGYPETTLDAIVTRASCSLSTFYSHFADKEEAVLATLDRGGALLAAAVLPAFRRGQNWPTAVRTAMGAMGAFAVAEPAFTKLAAVDVYSAGRRALEQRDQAMAAMRVLVADGFTLNPDVPPIAAEAIGGAIYTLTYDQVMAAGPESLPEITPLATYLVLAPFLGAEAAVRVANGDGRRNGKRTNAAAES